MIRNERFMQWLNDRIIYIKRFGYFLWLAMTLATLFFYPLTAALHDHLQHFLWKKVNSAELFGAFLLFSLIFFVLLLLIFKIREPHLRLFIALIISLVPFMSFGSYLVRQLRMVDTLTKIGLWLDIHMVFVFFIGGGITIFILFLFLRFPKEFFSTLIGTIFILSFLTPLFFGVVILAAQHDTTIAIDRRGEVKTSDLSASSKSIDNVILLLFDELSYPYLYDEKGVIKSEYPNLANLAAVSDNYHRATSPGTSTHTSLWGYLTGDRYDYVRMEKGIATATLNNNDIPLTLDDNNIFTLARKRGATTLFLGFTRPFCEMWGTYLDMCRSYSIWNYAGVNPTPSLINPIFTNIILWPHQPPLGWLKIPIYARWKNKAIENIYQSTIEAIKSESPIFTFTHFYLPHSPFVFNRDGLYLFKNPYLQNHDNYINQLAYVDTLVGKFIDEMKQLDKFDASTIIIFSDHNYRVMFPNDRDKIPLLIKRPRQKGDHNIYESVKAEEILQEILKENGKKI